MEFSKEDLLRDLEHVNNVKQEVQEEYQNLVKETANLYKIDTAKAKSLLKLISEKDKFDNLKHTNTVVFNIFEKDFLND